MLPGKGIDYPKFFLLYAKLNKKKRRIKELRSSKHIKLQTAVLPPPYESLICNCIDACIQVHIVRS